MKKTLALLLAVLCALALTPVTAFAATNGNFTVTVKGYAQNAPTKLVTLATAYVPYGSKTLAMSYVWDATNLRFELVATQGASYVSIPSGSRYINNRNMSNTSFSYTSPKTGNGSQTKYLYGNAILSAQKQVKVNIGSLGSVSTALSAAAYGRYTINASTLQSQITTLITGKGYSASDFDFTQKGTTTFAYNGCSDINFAFAGSIATPVTTATPAATPVATPTAVPTVTPAPNADCTLKVYAARIYGDEVTADSPSYRNSFKTEIVSGQSYKWLSPDKYGIIVKEGYEFDYYYDNAKRAVGSSSYVASHLSGWTAVAYFKEKSVTAKNITVKFVNASGDIIATSNVVVNGKYWDAYTVNATALFEATQAKTDGYTISGATSKSITIGNTSSVTFAVNPPASAVTDPIVNTNGITVDAFSYAGQISSMKVSIGHHTSEAQMDASGTCVDVTSELMYNFAGINVPTEVTVRLVKIGGGEYFSYKTITPLVPTVKVNGQTISADANKNNVTVMYIAEGAYNTFEQMRDSGKCRNISDTKEFTATGITAATTYTVRMSMSDGGVFMFSDIVVLPATRGVTVNGMTITVNDPAHTLTLVNIAKGRYTKLSEMNASGTCRIITEDLTYTATDITTETVYTIRMVDDDDNIYYEYATVTPASAPAVNPVMGFISNIGAIFAAFISRVSLPVLLNVVKCFFLI